MKKPFSLSTEGMQQTGIHYMGAGLDHSKDLDPSLIAKAQQKAQEDQLLYVNNMMEKDKDCKSYKDKVLVPIGNRVIVMPYDKNPYRKPLQETSSGLIYGDFDSASMYKSQETGEQEESQKGVWCCKVIAAGSECKTVVPGDDVYINFLMAAPVPFGNLGYYSIGETNIMCAVRPE